MLEVKARALVREEKEKEITNHHELASGSGVQINLRFNSP